MTAEPATATVVSPAMALGSAIRGERSTMKRWLVILILLAGLGAGGAWIADRQGLLRTEPAVAATTPAPVRATPVVTAKLAPTAMPVFYRTIGSVQPLASVAIRARVDSVIDKVLIDEGQEVKAGDPLFTLDNRTYVAQLAQAQANLERDRANLIKAQGDVRRYDELVRTNAIARSQLDAAVAQANALEATIKADQAQVDSAKLSLDFTRINAPMDGRAGAVFAKAGTMVRAAEATPLVNIAQLRPITVSFNLPEKHLPAIRAALAAGSVAVSAITRDQSGVPVKGRLSFIDNQIDQSTGTIVVKAEFPNEDDRLWPGSFVDVEVTLSVDDHALTLPDVAVMTGQDGRFVFLVKPDSTVEMRAVKVARVQDGKAVIAEGLTAGDTVVIEGQSRLVPGTKVADRSRDEPDPAKDGAGRTNAKTGGKEKRS